MMKALTIYLIPPVLSLIVSLILAGIAIRTKPRTTELKLFSIVCMWWGLLSPVFISHHLLDSTARILVVERFIHFFYVFLPALNILFVHYLLGTSIKSYVRKTGKVTTVKVPKRLGPATIDTGDLPGDQFIVRLF